MDAVRDSEAAGGEDIDPWMYRVEVELHRASRPDCATDRPLCESGRPRERDRGERLRVWDLGGTGGGGSGCGVGEVGGAGGRGANGYGEILEELRTPVLDRKW